jgi:hypothetical protein
MAGQVILIEIACPAIFVLFPPKKPRFCYIYRTRVGVAWLVPLTNRFKAKQTVSEQGTNRFKAEG